MERMLDNFTNGNLTDAKNQAKSFRLNAIYLRLIERGYSANKAHTTAAYLKGQATFQAACDAE